MAGRRDAGLAQALSRVFDARLPPPLLLMLLAAAMWAIDREVPGFTLRTAATEATAALLAIAGLVANLMPKLAFSRAGTTVNPVRPSRATALVTTGLHGVSRNPMYVGQVLLLAAWALYLGHAIAALCMPVQIAWLTWLQVVPEERALDVKFGVAWQAYRGRVPRWL
jgi:protein-S-isoprenylcysteine O-methyltransferase Ste14